MAKKVNITPLHDRVLVEAAEAETTSAGGIIIPDTATEKPQRGKVIAVGNGKPEEPMTVKVGNTVLYGKYAGTELNVDGTDYLIMRESDILAIVQQEIPTFQKSNFKIGNRTLSETLKIKNSKLKIIKRWQNK